MTEALGIILPWLTFLCESAHYDAHVTLQPRGQKATLQEPNAYQEAVCLSLNLYILCICTPCDL